MPTPTHIFSRIENYRCVKKKNFELIDIFNYEPEFKYTDIVIMSCGVNDLARYGKRAHVLADLVAKRLAECCERNRDTTFIFNSNLSTSHAWLNEAIEQFSHVMFRLSLEVPNLVYFDSHAVLKRNPISSGRSQEKVIQHDGDGVHITREARRVITDQLVKAVDFIAHQREGFNPCESVHLSNWQWPLRIRYMKWFNYFSSQLARSAG